jgi:hypothetical protein
MSILRMVNELRRLQKGGPGKAGGEFAFITTTDR